MGCRFQTCTSRQSALCGANLNTADQKPPFICRFACTIRDGTAPPLRWGAASITRSRRAPRLRQHRFPAPEQISRSVPFSQTAAIMIAHHRFRPLCKCPLPIPRSNRMYPVLGGWHLVKHSVSKSITNRANQPFPIVMGRGRGATRL